MKRATELPYVPKDLKHNLSYPVALDELDQLVEFATAAGSSFDTAIAMLRRDLRYYMEHTQPSVSDEAARALHEKLDKIDQHITNASSPSIWANVIEIALKDWANKYLPRNFRRLG